MLTKIAREHLGVLAQRIRQRLAGFDVLADLADDVRAGRRSRSARTRIDRHLVSDRPALIIVANWRAKIVTSLGLTVTANWMLLSAASPLCWSSSRMM